MAYGPVKGGETTGAGDDETEDGAEGAAGSDAGVTGGSLHAASSPPEASNTAKWTARMTPPPVTSWQDDLDVGGLTRRNIRVRSPAPAGRVRFEMHGLVEGKATQRESTRLIAVGGGRLKIFKRLKPYLRPRHRLFACCGRLHDRP